MDQGLSMLAHASLLLEFWDEIFYVIVFMINRTPIPILNVQTLLENIFHVKPYFVFLKVFGCLCLPYIWPYNNNKLQFRSTPYIFLVYNHGYKGYNFLCRTPDIPSTSYVLNSSYCH